MLNQGLLPHTKNPQRWQVLLSDIPHSPTHSWEYINALSQTTSAPFYLYYHIGSDFKVICPLMVRYKKGEPDVTMPYGFNGLIITGQNTSFQKDMEDFLSSLGFVCGYITYNPFFHESESLFKKICIPSVNVYSLNLTKSREQLLLEMSKKTRYTLKQWCKRSYQIIDKKHLPINYAYQLYLETLRRVQATSIYYFSEECFTQLVTSNYSYVIAIGHERKISAFSMFIYNKFCAEYFINASDQNGRIHARGFIWHAIDYFKKKQIPVLNLGGGTKNDDSLADFKRRLGGQMIQTWKQHHIYNHHKFSKLCGSIHPKTSEYFPPYHLLQGQT